MSDSRVSHNAFSQRADAWDRWRWVWVLTYYGTLSASLVGAWFAVDTTTTTRPVIAGLSLLMALTQGIVFLRQRLNPDPRENWPINVFLFALQIAAWYWLVLDFPVFYLHLFSLFSQVNAGLPRRLAWVANIILTMGIALPQFLMFGWGWLSVGLFLVMGTVSIGFGLWIDGIIRQSAERRDLLQLLQQTQAELVASERREGVLEERSRLARDIHDTLAQSFIGVITHLEAAGQIGENNPEAIRQHLNQAEAVARDGLRQARQVVHDLRPQVLVQNETLGSALRNEAEKWSSHSGVPAAVEVTGSEIQLHPEVEVTLLRALQEGLANVAKHAQATAVQITLSYIGDRVALDIADNGRGFQNGERPSGEGGFGLQGMQERIADLQGELHIESEQGEGVNLAIVVPVVTR